MFFTLTDRSDAVRQFGPGSPVYRETVRCLRVYKSRKAYIRSTLKTTPEGCRPAGAIVGQIEFSDFWGCWMGICHLDAWWAVGVTRDAVRADLEAHCRETLIAMVNPPGRRVS